LFIDISPLRRHSDFRLVFIGQTVSALGGFLTYVALWPRRFCPHGTRQEN
jgi:hypothetical protein